MNQTIEQSRFWRFFRAFVALWTIALFMFGSFISTLHTHAPKISASERQKKTNSNPEKKNAEEKCFICLAKFSSGIVSSHSILHVAPIQERIFCESTVESVALSHFNLSLSRAPPSA